MTVGTRTWLGAAGGLLLMAAAGAPWGCSSSPEPVPGDSLSVVQNPAVSPARRAEAVPKAWEEAKQGKIEASAVRRDFKALAWSPKTPQPLRLAVLRALLSDESKEGIEDSRAMARLMLPHETSLEVIELLSNASAAGGWTEMTPVLVRSLSRAQPGTPDERRAEYVAIQSLNPGVSVASVTYGVFLRPGPREKTYGVDTAMRTRAAAWDLLARLDSDGATRIELISSGGTGASADADSEESADSARVVEDLHACLRELRTLPLTGDELTWLVSLRNFRTPGHQEWWTAASGAIATLDPAATGRLRLRHAEPIRWAAANRSEWISSSREGLMLEVQARLKGRAMHRRVGGTFESARKTDERLADWSGQLLWGDLLTILVADEAVHDRAVGGAVFAQALMDRKDTGTEYGGLLVALDVATGQGPAGGPGSGGAGSAPGFQAIMFPPRPATRQGDQQFVASDDMIRQGDHALAHYHFHAQSSRNADYAGPSEGDLGYAARSGRTCLVFTSIGDGVLGADLYQSDGVIIDLGEIKEVISR